MFATNLCRISADREFEIRLCGSCFYFAMVLAAAAFGVVQVPANKVVDVIAMRHRLMPASGTMFVALFMAAAFVVWRG